MKFRQQQGTITIAAVTAGTNSSVINLDGASSLSIVTEASINSTVVGGIIQLQVSNDKTNWVNYGTSTTFTTAGNSYIEMASVSFLYARVNYAITSGSYAIAAQYVTSTNLPD